MENEIWKDVKGFESRYKVSNKGNIISINGRFKGEKILIPNVGTLGYYQTTLRDHGKKRNVRVHTIIAETFLEKPTGNWIVVNHKDGNKLNNCVDNLEWIEGSANVAHAVATGLMRMKGERHPLRKLNDRQVFRIKFLSFGIDNSTLGKRLGVSREQVRDIRLNKNWKHITENYFSNSNSASVGA